MMAFGNFDSELGGLGQEFPQISGSSEIGNMDSEIAAQTKSSGVDMSYFRKLGEALMQRQFEAQQQQQEQMNMDAGSLTAGFNHNWLSQSLASGSANGAKI